MRRNRLYLAVVAALASGVAPHASALNLNQFDANTISVFTGGSTALDGTIEAYMRYICTNGSLDEYQFNTPQTNPAGGNIYSAASVLQRVFFCTLDGTKVTNASLAGKKLLMRKSAGDSGEGVVGPGLAVTINYAANPTLNGTTVTNYTCPTTAGTVTAANGQLGSLNIFACSNWATQTNTTGPAGFSDVEPSLLNTVLVPQVSASNLAGMAGSTSSIAANVWGVPVTKKLRDALQKVQNLTVGAEDEANMPSLPRTVLAAIYTGNINSWTFLTDGNNTPITGAAGVTPPGDNNIYLVRRPDSSGTQTSFKVMLTNFPCANTAQWPQTTPPNTQQCNTSGGGLVVSLQQGTGGLLSCLGTLNAASKWGVGLASTSNNPCGTGNTTCTSDAGWRYIKVDGRAPTLLNAATGKTDLFTEATLQWQSSGAFAPSGLVLSFLQEMAGQLATPAVLSAVNSGAAAQTYASPNIWYAGVMTPASNLNFNPSYPLTVASVNGTPMLTTTRAPLSPNSCQPPVQFGLNIPVDKQ